MHILLHSDKKVRIEQTSIPVHLDHMLDILTSEEVTSERGSTGPCMEYLLQHKILETLYTLARTDVSTDILVTLLKLMQSDWLMECKDIVIIREKMTLLIDKFFVCLSLIFDSCKIKMTQDWNQNVIVIIFSQNDASTHAHTQD